MAHIVGQSGETAWRVESERIIVIDWLRAASIAVSGAGAGAVAWATRLGNALPPLLAAFAAALGGVAWLLATSFPAGSILARASGQRMHAVAAAAELALGGGTGAVFGAATLATAPVDTRAWVGLAGLLVSSAAAWWRVRHGAETTYRLKAGRVGEARVVRELAHLPNDYIVLNDLTLSGPTGACEVDSLVLGPTGIWVIETKRWSGTITPGRTARDPWTQQNRRGTFPRPSPAEQLDRAQRAVADRLGVPPDAVTPILVLIGGRLAGEAPVRVESLGTLRRAITQAPTRWPCTATPIEAAQAFFPRT